MTRVRWDGAKWERFFLWLEEAKGLSLPKFAEGIGIARYGLELKIKSKKPAGLSAKYYAKAKPWMDEFEWHQSTFPFRTVQLLPVIRFHANSKGITARRIPNWKSAIRLESPSQRPANTSLPGTLEKIRRPTNIVLCSPFRSEHDDLRQPLIRADGPGGKWGYRVDFKEEGTIDFGYGLQKNNCLSVERETYLPEDHGHSYTDYGLIAIWNGTPKALASVFPGMPPGTLVWLAGCHRYATAAAVAAFLEPDAWQITLDLSKKLSLLVFSCTATKQDGDILLDPHGFEVKQRI